MTQVSCLSVCLIVDDKVQVYINEDSDDQGELSYCYFHVIVRL